MKAVILVGGPGTRLQPLTDTVPKSMVPVLTVPVMEHTLAYLRQFGIEDIILTLSYLPDVIRESLGDGSQCGVRLSYCIEEEPLGTAGAVKNAAGLLDGEPFVVLNGDVFTDLNIGNMLQFHRERGSKATIALHQVDDPSAFGVVEMDETCRVKAFIEKPPKEEATTDWINAGTYILEADVLDMIPDNCHYMFERGLYPSMLSGGDPVYGYHHRGYWLDMGTPGKYYALNADILEGRYHSPATTGSGINNIVLHPEATVDPTARLSGAVLIDRGAHIGKHVTVKGPSIIGANSRLGDHSEITASIVWDGVSIGSSVRLAECIVSRNVTLDHKSDISLQVVTTDRSAPLVIQK